jgi:hypothetical protein
MPTVLSGSGSADFHTALPVTEGGTGATASTGSGNVVLSASPTLTGTVNAAAVTVTTLAVSSAVVEAGYLKTTNTANSLVRRDASGNFSAGIITGSRFDGAVLATTLNTSGAVVFNDAGADVDFRVEGDADPHLIFADASVDRVGIGGADTSLFNGAGTNVKLAVIGSSNNTNLVQNGGAAIAIVNTDQTDENTAGLHFARADTDDTPNYAGASIVAQFKETQATGQYPSATLNFLTSPSQNAAPTLKMTIDSAGRITGSTGHPSFGNYQSTASSNNVGTASGTFYPKTNYTSFGTNWTGWNNGSHFNTTNGKFTAPVAGIYQFNAKWADSSTNMAHRRIFQMRINTTFHEFAESYDAHEDNGTSILVKLAANDTVEVGVHTGAQNDITTLFSGFLVVA